MADRLADELDRQAKAGDFFKPARVVVPNRYLRKWLTFHLARKLGVAIHLHFETLETALWNMLRETDPAAAAAPPENVDDNTYRLMVLSVLLEGKDPNAAAMERYLQRDGGGLSRLSCRRAWQLADRFGSLIRDYEYARQDELIQHWLQKELALTNATAFQQMMERTQRALFNGITREPDGKRARLNRHGATNYKTFPQYAMERMLSSTPPSSNGAAVHFFGFTEICSLHARAIAWLGQAFDIRVYHLNVLASRFTQPLNADTMQAFAREFREHPAAMDPGGELLSRWGRAGAESLDVLAALAEFDIVPLATPITPKGNGKNKALCRLHDHLLGNAVGKTRLPQDTSVQIVGCPGVLREVETAYNSILANLNANPSLRQTDIGVVVTDMAKYRAALNAVFERPPKRLQYNMVDFSAAGASTFGQAFLGMLDLALESFARSKVFAVLLNPCFLARLGVDRGQAMTWLDWAESLGIHQGWDAQEKAEQGYAASPLYSWRRGLERLRLGRYMNVTEENDGAPASRFGEVIPFADLSSNDREHLDAFCRAVEGLLPALARLRTAKMNGARWANELRRLAQFFLDVPADRPEETHVRAALLIGIDELARWDLLHAAADSMRALPLALVREYMMSQLQTLPGSRGQYLVGGVTIAELQPMRPVPFAVVYILGLGEDSFPGSNTLSSFDLRGAERRPGDIRPAEARLYDFLATVLSADQKLYLLYNNRNLQKDQELLPAIPLVQLERFLSDHVLKSEFQQTTMPAHTDDVRFLDPAQQPEHQDVLVQPLALDRALAVRAAVRDGRLKLDAAQEMEWARQSQSLHKDFAVASAPGETATRANTVSFVELRRFLRLPAEASLRRHLGVDEEDERTIEDDEPLVTTRLIGATLVRQLLEQLIRNAAQVGVEAALAAWPDRFAQVYDDARLRSQAPDEAFGAIDHATLAAQLRERIHGQGQIETFLRERQKCTFCGPILIGESLTPIGAKLRFPALRFTPGEELEPTEKETRVVGWSNLAWHSAGRFEILVLTSAAKIETDKVHFAMFEPALLYMALVANAERNADGMASQAWLRQREFCLHVAYTGGIQTWTYPAGSVTSAEAAAYLVQLTRDFLAPESFDLLPFDVVRENTTLRLAMQESAPLQMNAEAFRSQLVEAIVDVRENAYSKVRIPAMVDMIGAAVPADALAKVQRRFRLLDRGPALVRQQPRFSKGRPAKR